MTHKMSLAQKFRMPRIMRKAITSMALLSLSTGVFAKTDTARLDSKLRASTSLVVPDLNEWQNMNFADAKVVTPKKVSRGVVKPYNEAKVMQIVDLVLENTQYDAYFEEASLMTGIPAIYLKIKCAAESGLKTNAKSHTGPLGIAQFTKATARACGLKVTSGRDERLDPRKAIIASATYTAFNLGRADGRFFTTKDGGKNSYGAMAYYYGIGKSGDWKQYEANLKAVYDYFDLEHTLDAADIIPVQNDWKAKKLRPQNQDEFKAQMVAKKESLKDDQQVDPLFKELQEKLGKDLPNFDVKAEELRQISQKLNVSDNIVVARPQMDHIVLDKTLADMKANMVHVKAQQDVKVMQPDDGLASSNTSATKATWAAFRTNGALGAKIKNAAKDQPYHQRSTVFGEFRNNTDLANNTLHRNAPNFANPVFQQYAL